MEKKQDQLGELKMREKIEELKKRYFLDSIRIHSFSNLDRIKRNILPTSHG